MKKPAKKANKSPAKKKTAGINDTIAKAFVHLNNQLGGAVLMQRTYMVELFSHVAKRYPVSILNNSSSAYIFFRATHPIVN